MASFTTAHWWQPSDPQNSLPGVLFEDEEQGWLLPLDGSFQESNLPQAGKEVGPVKVSFDVPSEFPILVGTTSQGRLVSLFHCQITKASPAFINARWLLTIRPLIVVYDVHFAGVDDFRLTSLSIRYSNLDAWVATSGFVVQFDPKLYPVQVTYSTPQPIEVEIADGLKIGVGFSASGPLMPAISEVRITQQSWLTITSNKDLLYQQLLDHLVSLADLVSLAVGKSLRPLEISATCNAQNWDGGEASPVSIKLVHNQEPITPASRDVAYWEMLFTFPEIRERFGSLIAAWFSRDAKLQSLYDLYFGTMRSPWMYVEQRFLNMFQALESYDRRSFERPPEKKKAHEERLDRILSAVSVPQDKSWLEDRLRLSHEPSAEQRIRRLVAEHDAQWLLSYEDIGIAVRFRNYYTHFDPKSGQKLPPPEERSRKTHNLGIRLQALCELVLLVAIGMSKEYVKARMVNTQRVERRLVA